jgi:hypothetical protein
VRVTSTELSFGYPAGCGQFSCNRSEIETVEVLDRINGFCDWAGYGIRWQLPTWECGYIPKNGSGIRITLKRDGKEKAYTFICDEAEKVADILTGES